MVRFGPRLRRGRCKSEVSGFKTSSLVRFAHLASNNKSLRRRRDTARRARPET